MSTWPINLYPQDLGTYPWRRRAGGLGLNLLGGLGGILTTISVTFAPMGYGMLDPGTANVSVTIFIALINGVIDNRRKL